MTNPNHIKKIADDVYVNEGHYLTHDGINKCLIDVDIKDICDSDEILFKGNEILIRKHEDALYYSLLYWGRNWILYGYVRHEDALEVYIKWNKTRN